MTIWLHHPLGRVGFARTLHEENGVWVANCAALDIASQGNDPEDAVEMLKEALELVMEHCLEKNTWMTFLEKRGVTPVRAPASRFR